MMQFYFENLARNYKRIQEISTPAEEKAWINEMKKDACKKFFLTSKEFDKILKNAMEEEVQTMWLEGTIGIPVKTGGYKSIKYWVKKFEKPSKEYGLNGGKISKLSFKMDGIWIANYDRGWDLKPTCEEANIALSILLNEHN